RPLQLPSRLPMLNGISVASRALASTSPRYSATSGMSSRPRLTYSAVNTNIKAQSPSPQRVRATKKRIRRSMSGGPHGGSHAKRSIQPLPIKVQHADSEQHHVILFVGVHAFDL